MRANLKSKHLPLATTLLVFLVLYGVASVLYEGFFSARVAVNLVGDNAFLGIAAVGMTFVILSGGIDLSVGAVVAFTSILMATLVERRGWPPIVAIGLSVGVGSLYGASMGWLIQRFAMPAFLVTLGGMFFARGLAFAVSEESVGINHWLYREVFSEGWRLSERVQIPVTAMVVLVVAGMGIVLAHWTRFGRYVYAVGGNENSAVLMGLPVGRTKVLVYGLNGFCAALAGVVATFFMSSGNPAMGAGLELDVIAAVVIGGTLLSGGVGTVAGSLVGVMIYGTIQAMVLFDGRFNSWWVRIVMGVLLLMFILLQRFGIAGGVELNKHPGP